MSGKADAREMLSEISCHFDFLFVHVFVLAVCLAGDRIVQAKGRKGESVIPANEMPYSGVQTCNPLDWAGKSR